MATFGRGDLQFKSHLTSNFYELFLPIVCRKDEKMEGVFYLKTFYVKDAEFFSTKNKATSYMVICKKPRSGLN